MTEAPSAAGTRLRLARQARGLSQQQLAGMAAVTRQAVSAVESGHSDPSLRVALALASALGMTVEDLFGPGDPADPVLAQPVAPLGGEGSRVTLATIGDTFVALPLHADTAAQSGFGPAGGLVAGSPGGGWVAGRPDRGPRGAREARGPVPVRPIGWASTRPNSPATTPRPPATSRSRRPSRAVSPMRACRASRPRWPTGWTSSRWPTSGSTWSCRPSTPRPGKCRAC